MGQKPSKTTNIVLEENKDSKVEDNQVSQEQKDAKEISYERSTAPTEKKKKTNFQNNQSSEEERDLLNQISGLSLEEKKDSNLGNDRFSKAEVDWLKTSEPKEKGEVLMETDGDEIFGLMSWNYKHDSTAGKGGTDKTKEAINKLLDDISIDIFAIQELLWEENTYKHIPRLDDKYGSKPKNFEIIKTGKESGFYYNPSTFLGEKVDHVSNPTIDKDTFDYHFNNRTCIAKFTVLNSTSRPLVFYGVSYHGPKNAFKDVKRQEYTKEFFARIKAIQRETCKGPFFIAGDFNTNIENLEIEGLVQAVPSDDYENNIKNPIDFVCFLNTDESPWKISLRECRYEQVEHYQGVSTHPPIFNYLVFKYLENC